MADSKSETTLPRDLTELLEREAKARPFDPPVITCPRCGAKGVAFICSERGCPVNGGAAYDR